MKFIKLGEIYLYVYYCKSFNIIGNVYIYMEMLSYT